MSKHDTLTETHAMLNNTKSVYNLVEFLQRSPRHFRLLLLISSYTTDAVWYIIIVTLNSCSIASNNTSSQN